ncbi:hypothetical protein B0H19DRAFT_653604 [Mycena capillaripes]|nr:hypothetical protein B0H19DRAFT_653604 [Mycena capillaripes]
MSDFAANSRSCRSAQTLHLRFRANRRKLRRDEHGGMKVHIDCTSFICCLLVHPLLHIVPRPVPSIFRVDVYLRRGPSAPLFAGICRRDSLARPSSQSATLSAHVPLAIREKLPRMGANSPYLFFWQTSAATLHLKGICLVYASMTVAVSSQVQAEYQKRPCKRHSRQPGDSTLWLSGLVNLYSRLQNIRTLVLPSVPVRFPWELIHSIRIRKAQGMGSSDF